MFCIELLDTLVDKIYVELHGKSASEEVYYGL